jgi:Histidine kinase-like ATPase domain
MTQCVPSPRRRGHVARPHDPRLHWIQIMPMSSAVAEARNLVRELLAAADSDHIYNVQLVTSELVTNAIRLVQTLVAPPCSVDPAILLAIETHTRWTHLRVRDPYPKSLPMKRRPDASEESGRGVLISEVVADYVWVEVSTMDKVVHAVLTKPGVTLSQSDVASFGQSPGR